MNRTETNIFEFTLNGSQFDEIDIPGNQSLSITASFEDSYVSVTIGLPHYKATREPKPEKPLQIWKLLFN